MCVFILSYLDSFSTYFILDSSVYISAQFQTILAGCYVPNIAMAAVKYGALLGKSMGPYLSLGSQWKHFNNNVKNKISNAAQDEYDLIYRRPLGFLDS